MVDTAHTATSGEESEDMHFYHEASATTQWARPTISEHERAVATAAVAHAPPAIAAANVARAEERIAAGRAKRDAIFAQENAPKRAMADGMKQVRFKWNPRVRVSLADALLNHDVGKTGVPPYLSQVCRRIFLQSDRGEKKHLSVLDILFMLKTRARIVKPGIVYSFNAALTRVGGDTGQCTASVFELGIVDAIHKDEHGAVAQWILKEIQKFAAEWKGDDLDGVPFYTHPTLGTTWTKPAVVAAVERFAQLCSDAEDGAAAPRDSSGDVRRRRTRKASVGLRAAAHAARVTARGSAIVARSRRGAAPPLPPRRRERGAAPPLPPRETAEDVNGADFDSSDDATSDEACERESELRERCDGSFSELPGPPRDELDGEDCDAKI